MGLSDAAGNYVFDLANGTPQEFFLEGGIAGETVFIELLKSHSAHTSYLTNHNSGEKTFDESGKIKLLASCSSKSHLPNQDIYQVTWRNKKYVYAITYVDNR